MKCNSVAITVVKMNITASWKSDALYIYIYIGLQATTLPIILSPLSLQKEDNVH